MAMQFHPDRNPGDPTSEEKFKECSEAYAVLSDPQKRANYDRFGHAGVNGMGGGGFGGFEMGTIDFAEIFGDLFGFGDAFGGGAAGAARARSAAATCAKTSPSSSWTRSSAASARSVFVGARFAKIAGAKAPWQARRRPSAGNAAVAARYAFRTAS